MTALEFKEWLDWMNRCTGIHETTSDVEELATESLELEEAITNLVNAHEQLRNIYDSVYEVVLEEGCRLLGVDLIDDKAD